MQIGDSILRKWKEEVIIKSMIWNSIVEVFHEQKNINVTSYLVSIRLNKNTIFIKTNNPLINTELLLLDDKIKKLSSGKLKKVWIKFHDFDLKYL